MVDTEKEQEIWKVYPRYPFIEVSNLGRVRTKDRWVTQKNGNRQFVKGRVLKQQLNPYGYIYVGFRAKGKYVKLRVNRMVAITFIPNPNNYPEVNHIDNNPTNNAVSNLEWCNHQENIACREKYGVSAKEYTKVLRKPVIAIDLDSFKVFWFESQHEAARQLSVNQGNVNNVLKGRCNKTSGYCFYYADENTIEKIRNKFGNEVAREVEKLMYES